MTARRLPRSVRRSAAPIGARGVSNPGCRSSILICRILQSSDEIRVPLARRSRRPTDFSTDFPPAPVRLLHPSYMFYGISCLGGAQNSNSGRIRAQIYCILRVEGHLARPSNPETRVPPTFPKRCQNEDIPGVFCDFGLDVPQKFEGQSPSCRK